jgi:hypothetical protein
MRWFVMFFLVVMLAGVAGAQDLAPKAPATQYVTVESSMSAASASSGGTLMLWADVTPKRNIHVYAPGAKDVMPVSLVTTPSAQVTFASVQIPRGRPMTTIGTTEPTPVFTERFRIVQPVTISRSVPSGATVMVAAALNYQACDDRLCYPAAVLPVIWTISVK